MKPLDRARAGVRTITGDPVGRRAYIGRLKWLLRGSGSLHAHSLEYRAGLTGRWAIPAVRSAPDDEAVLHCPDHCSAHAPLSHLYERRFVYRLDRTVASTASGATLMCGSAEPPFFVRESITWPFESILTHGLEVPEVAQAKERVPRGIVFPTTPNYYHWLIEDVPAVIRAAREAPGTPLLSYANGLTDRHRTVGSLIGHELHAMPVVVAVDEQVLGGRSSDSWFVHPSDAALLMQLGRDLTTHDGAPGSDRIYVSRRGTSRPLPDEERLETALAQRGFTVLRLEEMPWADQVSAFQRASVIVAPHGAGLANLVFTPAGATVVELTFGLHYNRCFEWICHVSGHDYCKIDGDSGVEDPITQTLEMISRLST
jgi:Glycosyltransferase 61